MVCRMTLRLIALPLMSLAIATAAEAGEPHSLALDSVPATDWTGVYLGVHGGYGRGNTNWTFPFDEYYNTFPGQGFSTDPDGAVFGGHLTLDYQFGSFVVGVEGSFSGTTVEQDRTGPVAFVYPNDQYQTRIDNLAIVAGRLGYAFDNWLLYAKGGYATAQVSLHALSGPPGGGVTAFTKDRHDGWTAGAGVAYMIAPGVVFGIEYDFVELDAERHSTRTVNLLPTEPIRVDTDDIEQHAILARLSLRIGGERTPVPEPLK